jgi:asparagine N-glycosylation enzyme membrane subunit Stt3
MLGYLFLILTLIALERFRDGKQRAFWLLPFLMLLWVNTHGSWIIGLGTIFVYWMSGLVGFQIGSLEAKRWTPKERLTLSCGFLLCLLALPITPYGTRVAVSPFEFAFSLPLNVAHIQEWQSMPFNTVVGKIFLVLLIAIIIAQISLGLRWRLEELALFLFGTMMACLHVRFILIFVPFVAPVLAMILARWVPHYKRSKDKFVLNAALILLVLATMFRYFPSGGDLRKEVSKSFPVAAVDYLRKHPVPEPMYNNYGFGGYLVWSRGPEHKVFIDGRGDVYERGGLLSDYMHITYLEPGALDLLRAYHIQSCLLQRNESLATVLSASPEWQRVYLDDTSVLFVRASTFNGTESGQAISKLPPFNKIDSKRNTSGS